VIPDQLLVDASVWIDYLRGIETPQCQSLQDAMRAGAIHVADLTYFEVLQGCNTPRRVMQARSLLALYDPVIISDFNVADSAADNYRILRRRGITVHSSIDMLIGSWCILHSVPLLHNDRDYDALERYCGLKVVR
jgi:predicted nucleic acid-binding protein